MEASALQAPAGLARARISIGAPLLRLRSDEQLVASFRAGNDEAFRVIYDRYQQRLFAYTRQMLPGRRQDAEDALQDIFVRTYAGLRANDRQLALRAWLYRVAHNRCVDELRRPPAPPPEVIELVRSPVHDPMARVEQRESLRRLIADVQRLPEHQRSALLMRELGGMTYVDLAGALGVSVAAVKSLLVRARVGLAQALEARDTACSEIREELTVAHDRGVRPSGMARRHMHDCAGCREYRTQLRGVSRQLAALAPTLGPIGVLANALGIGGGAGGAAGTGGVAATAGAGHVATLLAAAVVTAGGAVELNRTISAPYHHHARHSTPALVQAAPGAERVAPASVSTTPPARAAAADRAAPTAPGTGAANPPAGSTNAAAPSGGAPAVPAKDQGNSNGGIPAVDALPTMAGDASVGSTTPGDGTGGTGSSGASGSGATAAGSANPSSSSAAGSDPTAPGTPGSSTGSSSSGSKTGSTGSSNNGTPGAPSGTTGSGSLPIGAGGLPLR